MPSSGLAISDEDRATLVPGRGRRRFRRSMLGGRGSCSRWPTELGIWCCPTGGGLAAHGDQVARHQERRGKKKDRPTLLTGPAPTGMTCKAPHSNGSPIHGYTVAASTGQTKILAA